jgi:hypothetical protein
MLLQSATIDSLPPDAVAAAQKRGRAQDRWATAEALPHELGWKPRDPHLHRRSI